MKIAILGTRGIPNNYGGFEQFAEFLAMGLTMRGHQLSVYSPHNHVYKEKSWKNVSLIHCFDPEYRIGTAGQFIYDLNCILDSRKRDFDVIFQLGYTSSSVFSWLFPSKTLVVTNMDGLEWKRTKYNKQTQKFLRYAEKVAVKKSDFLVADSLEIQKYIREKFNCDSEYIPYGATVFDSPDVSVLDKYDLKPQGYDMLIARLEPENSIDMILQGVANAVTDRKFLVIGNHETSFGKFLVNKYQSVKNIVFVGPEYNMTVINNLRYFSNLYFHGHTVGGTNPSLLEAMSSQALIAAHRNNFNSAILGADAYYFSNDAEVASLIKSIRKTGSDVGNKISVNVEKIKSIYSWESIINQYEAFFKRIHNTQ